MLVSWRRGPAGHLSQEHSISSRNGPTSRVASAHTSQHGEQSICYGKAWPRRDELDWYSGAGRRGGASGGWPASGWRGAIMMVLFVGKFNSSSVNKDYFTRLSLASRSCMNILRNFVAQDWPPLIIVSYYEQRTRARGGEQNSIHKPFGTVYSL